MFRKLSLLALVLPSALLAQTPISGAIYDGNGGPLLSGVVYHATSNLSVPAGQTLTIQAGAVIKLRGMIFSVDGTLLSQGTAANPVIITSLFDDSAGGDTNGDGNATSGAVSQWYGIVCSDSADASVFQHTSVRFTGLGGFAATRLSACDATLVDCEFRDGGRGGLQVDTASRPTVTRCNFIRQAVVPAAFGFALDALAGCLDNTAVDCAGGNYLRVDSATTDITLGLVARNMIGGVLAFLGNFSVRSNGALTFGAGVVVKAVQASTITFDGPLFCNGTVAEPVVFTSFADDSAGGDTNGDGAATAGGPNQFYGLRFNDGSDSSVLNYTQIRSAGIGGWEGVACYSADITMTDCEIRDSGSGGMRCDPQSRPQVSRCSFTGIAGEPAIFGMSIAAVPGFLDNTVSNCPGGNYLRVDSATVSADLSVQRRNLPRNVLAFLGNLSVASGVTLDLAPGVIVKPIQNATLTINGTLLCPGTEADPVVFTSWLDDSYGGDTNGDGGATVAGVNQYYGLRFNSGAGASRLEHVVVRCGGTGGWPGLDAYSDITVLDSEVRDQGRGGFRASAQARPTVRRCRFVDIGGLPAVSGVHWEAVAGFVDNEAENCSAGPNLWIARTSVAGLATVNRRNQINGAFVYEGNGQVNPGGRLLISAGVVLKARVAGTFTVDGEMRASGLVVFTSYRDDAWGGDSNGDGNNSQPGASNWYGIRVNAGALGVADAVLVRYAGAGGWPGIDSYSAQFSLLRCRAEFCGSGGFRLQDVASAEQLVAYGNIGHGVFVRGDLAIARSTSAYNSGDGINISTQNTGRVTTSVSFGNAGTGYVGYPAGSIDHSLGSGIVGGAGNRGGDPLFRDAATGDLRLQAGSPCVDDGFAGFATTGLDFFGNPRVLDGNLDGIQRVDMGAYEFSHVRLTVTGDPAPGNVLNLVLDSTPSMFAGGLAIGLDLPNPTPLLNLGPLFVDLNGAAVAFLVGTNSSTPLSIPANVVTPLTITAQGLGLALPFPRGNMSNPVRIFIE